MGVTTTVHATGQPTARILRWAREEPERLGRLLLASVALLIALTAPLQAHDQRAWIVASTVVVSLGLLAVLARSLPDAWLRGPGAAVCPLLVMGALAGFSGAGDGLAVAYGGVLTLCFVVTGVTATTVVNLLLVPAGAATFVVVVGSWSSTLLVRTVIAVLVWILVTQLLCALTRAQDDLTVALRTAATTDALTGLSNRRALDEQLAELVPGDLIVLCDLDWFKTFNDRFGHQAGDRLLANFGLLLSTRLRGNDTAARYGGEEFAILLRNTRMADGQAIIERLHRTWAALHESVTFSSGLAAHLPGADAADTLLAADRALYHAKSSGRGCSRTAMAAAAGGAGADGRRAGDRAIPRIPRPVGPEPAPVSS